ncbi:hypothetical protein G3I76_48095, partial [Streptomyces sp. SID11233]|nr:hypothetical protein [Streptomyces sp. SID11233]
MTLTESAALGIATGVSANLLWAAGTHGKAKAQQALLWLTRRERNRATVSENLAAFTPDADELINT